MKNKKEIQLWGLYPPPIGGVSIHIMRLIHSLNGYERIELLDFKPKKEYNVDYVTPVKSKIFELIKLAIGRKKIIHVHMTSPLFFLSLMLFGFRHSIGITMHNQRAIKDNNIIKKNIYKLFFNHCSFIIMNDAKYSERFAKCFKLRDKSKIHIVPAFILPTEQERIGILPKVKTFREAHDFMISANAFRLVIENDVDIYGLDLLIELLYKLRCNAINAGLLFCLPEIGNKEYYNTISLLIEDRKLKDHVMILNKAVSNGFEYWEVSDVFIRPTNTDMEGLSVKEALFVGTCCVASDVCKRPDNCILFRNRNFNDLYEKVYNVYKKGEYKKKQTLNETLDVVKDIYNIYKSI